MIDIIFECPHCKEGKTKDDKVDERWYFDQERIQSSDDLNADPKANIRGKMELWYCYLCGRYFRVYYKLFKIVPLEEMQGDPATADKEE